MNAAHQHVKSSLRLFKFRRKYDAQLIKGNHCNLRLDPKMN